MISNFYTNVELHRGAILHRGFDNEGKRFSRKENYSPYIFTSSGADKTSKYKTIFGDTVKRIDFPSCTEAEKHCRNYHDVAGYTVYGFHGQKFLYSFIHDTYPSEVLFNPRRIRIGYLDIEVKSDGGFPDVQEADREVTAICLKITYMNTKMVIVLGCGNYKNNRADVVYIKCKDERDLFVKFLKAWEKADLDVVTGWNVDYFDIPYIVNRINRVFGTPGKMSDHAKMLSPWRVIKEGSVRINVKQENQVYNILGVATLDYLRMYKKFPLPERESYTLDYISHAELGKSKIDYSEFGSLLSLYKNDYQKFIDYNIRDTELVEELEEKLGLLQQCFAIAYDARALYIDALTTVNLWDVIIHGALLDDDTVIPNPKRKAKTEQIEGAYVKTPQFGIHDWVCSFDLKSLYPHLIMQYNISPETYYGDMQRLSIDEVIDGGYEGELHEYALTNNATMTPAGTMFTRNEMGFLPRLMQHVYDERVVWKTRMLDAEREYEKNPTKDGEIQISICHNMQMAKKIQMNGVYGALSNEYFRWYNDTLAESVTLSGQLATKWIEKHINKYLNKRLNTDNVDYVLAADTDSVYIALDKLVTEECDATETSEIVTWLDNICATDLDGMIAIAYEKLAKYTHAYSNKMSMKREFIANKGFWTAKKRYALNVYDNEGVRYSKPKIKLKGLEAVRSSTPSVCRNKIVEVLDIIMNRDNNELIKFIDKFREEFQTLPFEDIAFPRGVHELDKYASVSEVAMFDDKIKKLQIKKGTPIHIRAAMVYNNMIRKLSLNNQYEFIQSDDKIKFCYLCEPNPSRAYVIGCLNVFPKEFELEQHINRDLQFEKTFLNPVTKITDAIGWTVKQSNNLEIFFN